MTKGRSAFSKQAIKPLHGLLELKQSDCRHSTEICAKEQTMIRIITMLILLKTIPYV